MLGSAGPVSAPRGQLRVSLVSLLGSLKQTRMVALQEEGQVLEMGSSQHTQQSLLRVIRLSEGLTKNSKSTLTT